MTLEELRNRRNNYVKSHAEIKVVWEGKRSEYLKLTELLKLKKEEQIQLIDDELSLRDEIAEIDQKISACDEEIHAKETGDKTLLTQVTQRRDSLVNEKRGAERKSKLSELEAVDASIIQTKDRLVSIASEMRKLKQEASEIRASVKKIDEEIVAVRIEHNRQEKERKDKERQEEQERY